MKVLHVNGVPISRGPRGLAGPDGNPIGTVISFMGTTPPKDYLACDGSTYNIADYPNLAAFFATQFGSSNHFGGDGETTFGVPDLESSADNLYCIKAVESPSATVGSQGGSVTTTDVYSTEETVIGRWIDNKPLYRKVFNVILPAQNTHSIEILTYDVNVEQVVKLYGNAVIEQQATPIPNYYSDTDYCVNLFYNLPSMVSNPKTLRAHVGLKAANCPAIIFFEYTKTTDDPLPPITSDPSNTVSTANLTFGHGLTTTKAGSTTTVAVDTVDDFSGDKTLPISAVGVETQIGNIESLMETI